MRYRIEHAKGATAGASGVHLPRKVFCGSKHVANLTDLGKVATDGCVTLTYNGMHQAFANDRAALRFLQDFGSGEPAAHV